MMRAKKRKRPDGLFFTSEIKNQNSRFTQSLNPLLDDQTTSPDAHSLMRPVFSSPTKDHVKVPNVIPMIAIKMIRTFIFSPFLNVLDSLSLCWNDITNLPQCQALFWRKSVQDSWKESSWSRLLLLRFTLTQATKTPSKPLLKFATTTKTRLKIFSGGKFRLQRKIPHRSA